MIPSFEQLELWGYTPEQIAAMQGYDTVAVVYVPVDERCWRCDKNRIHEGCHAALCMECCTQLKAAPAA